MNKEKPLTISNTLFLIKLLSKIRIEVNFSTMEDRFKKSRDKIILNGEIPNTFPVRPRKSKAEGLQSKERGEKNTRFRIITSWYPWGKLLN